MNPVAASVNKAVELIGVGPDDILHVECVKAVQKAFREIPTEDALRDCYGTAASIRAAEQLHDSLRRLQGALKDPQLSAELRLNAPIDDRSFHMWLFEADKGVLDEWLAMWVNRADAETKKRPDRYQPKAHRKLIAANKAKNLFEQFNKPISGASTKGSDFCKLAALLYGTPRANFTYPCLEVMRRSQTK